MVTTFFEDRLRLKRGKLKCKYWTEIYDQSFQWKRQKHQGKTEQNHQNQRNIFIHSGHHHKNIKSFLSGWIYYLTLTNAGPFYLRKQRIWIGKSYCKHSMASHND